MKTIFSHFHYQDNSHITQCTIEDDARRQIAQGFSICSPKDNFCRRIGREISQGRAHKALNLKKSLNPIYRIDNLASDELFQRKFTYKALYLKE